MTDQYAASVVESRGRLQTNQGGRRRDYRPLISVTFADKHIARAFLEHVGRGHLNTFNPRSNPSMTIHAWECKGAGAVEVLERLTPHMLGSLREHAEYILARDRARDTKNGAAA